jgi:DNA-directed RNA polymerase subunit RPC12/RpoP
VVAWTAGLGALGGEGLMAKRSIVMRVIPEPSPGSRAVLIPRGSDPGLRGGGPLSYTCGKCGTTLLKDLMFEQARNFVVKCGKCGVFNETPPGTG